MARLLHYDGSSRLWGRLSPIFLLVLALASTLCRPSHAVGTFISAPYRVDHIHDTKRNVIYISSGNTVLRYSVGAGAFMPPYQLSGSLSGMDLSPDGDTLAVANRTAITAGITAAPFNSIYLINLIDNTSRRVDFPLASNEGGTWTVAYGNDGRILITSQFNGSGWVPLRRYNPATGEIVKLADVRQDTMLSAAGGRSLIGFAESNSSDGPWGTYRVSDGTLVKREWYENGTSAFNYEIGVNSSGTQFSIPTYSGTYIYDANYQKLATIGVHAGGQPIGVAYHPFQPKIYFPWAESGEVRVYDSNTYQQTGRYDFETTFGSNGNNAFGNGRAKVSRDGSYLAVSVSGGVRFVGLGSLTANSQNVSVAEDSSVGITLSATGATPGTFTTYSIIREPLHGTLTTSATQSQAYRLYTPRPNYYGSDSFVFQVTNNNQISQATVSINVTPVTDYPIAENSSASTLKNTSVTVSLPASDGDNNALTYEVVSWPAHGSVTLGTGTQLGKAVYTPGAYYSGLDSFTWRARDGYYYSNVATASISVANNSAPVAYGDAYRTPAMTALTIEAPGVLANDINQDGSAFTAVLNNQSQYGQIALRADGSFTWTPPTVPPGTTGPINETIRFSYRAVSATGQSAVTTVTIAQNHKPVASSQTVSTDEDVALPITLTATDRDQLTYRVVNAPTNGTLSGTAPNLTYTPNTDFSGSDSFTFVANDGLIDSNPATVSITVRAVETAPVATPQNLTGDEDVALDIVLSGTDADGDA
ncbi:MAG TPA: Ig-like domain-containing protein, partial [Abditibacterium sp.]